MKSFSGTEHWPLLAPLHTIHRLFRNKILLKFASQFFPESACKYDPDKPVTKLALAATNHNACLPIPGVCVHDTWGFVDEKRTSQMLTFTSDDVTTITSISNRIIGYLNSQQQSTDEHCFSINFVVKKTRYHYYIHILQISCVLIADECTLVTAAGRRHLRSADNRTWVVKRSRNQQCWESYI